MKRMFILITLIGLVVWLNGYLLGSSYLSLGSPNTVPEIAANKPISNEVTRLETVDLEVGELAFVSGIIDGDTIEVNLANGEKALVRYIGIDTPELARENQPLECFAKEATLRNKELVDNHQVRLVKDVRETDQYGRLLRYVYDGDTMVNAELIKEGMATAVTFPPDVSQAKEFRELETNARLNKLGLWGDCQ